MIRRRYILVIAAAFVIAALGYAAILVTGTCFVLATNTGTRTIALAVSTAGEPIGSARLAPGDRLLRVFVPDKDGEIDVECRDINTDTTIKSSGEYVTGNMAMIYSISVPSCDSVGVRGTPVPP